MQAKFNEVVLSPQAKACFLFCTNCFKMKFFATLKILITFLLITTLNLKTFATEPVTRMTVRGIVVDYNSEEPLPNVPVLITELNLYVVTDKDGVFEFSNIPEGKYLFYIKSLGYQPLKQNIEVNEQLSKLVFRLQIQSLALENIDVVATKGSQLTASSELNQQAIEHIQPTNIKDILQLLPGALAQNNQQLNSVKQLSIRSLSTNDAGLGVSLIIDGTVMDNSHNMQVLRSTGTLTTAGQGIDTRQFSTDNIESIEVIRGIPSVEYGNMTSGGVIVKTKSGESPLQIRLKTDPYLKLIAIGKGLNLKNHTGVVNIDMDYTHSNADLTTPRSAYNRFNLNLGHSLNPNSKLSLNSKFVVGFAQSKDNNDPDILQEYLLRNSEMRARATINGSWRPNKPWLSQLDFNVSGGIQDQLYHEKKYIAGTQAGTFSPYNMGTESGIYQGLFTKRFYQYWLKVHGMPIDFQARITGRLFAEHGKIKNAVMAGIELNSKGNRGRGKSFDLDNPPSYSSVSLLRERTFRDIPFLNTLAVYGEDKLTIPTGKTHLELQAGVRLNTVLPNTNYTLNSTVNIEPRFNARYTIFSHQKIVKDLGIRAGWGLTSVVPTMSMLFPEPVYYDRLVFSHQEPTADNFDLAYGFNLFEVVKRTDNINPELKMPQTRKAELALEFKLEKLNGEIIFFHEQSKDLFGLIESYEAYNYQMYGYSSLNTLISYPTGSRFQFNSDEKLLYVTRPGETSQVVPMLADTVWRSFSLHGNNGGNLLKWGIEYSLNLTQIKSIRTTININGAYFREQFYNNNIIPDIAAQATTSSARAKYLGFYPGATTPGNGWIRDRFNTTFRLITHLPKIGFVTTLTTQVVWYEGSQTKDNFNGTKRVYYYRGEDFTSEKVYGSGIHSVEGKNKYMDPLYLMDKQGNVIPFTDAMSRDPEYRLTALKTSSSPLAFMKTSYTPWVRMDLRLSKDIGQFGTIAFFANNFLNMPGIRRIKYNGELYQASAGQAQNPSPSFGAEIKFRISTH